MTRTLVQRKIQHRVRHLVEQLIRGLDPNFPSARLHSTTKMADQNKREIQKDIALSYHFFLMEKKIKYDN